MSRKSKHLKIWVHDSPPDTLANRDRHGIVLLVTLVVLMVLATLVCNLTSRVASQRHRNNYLIDYTSACYARDSAVKYAMTILNDLNDLETVPHPNEPDFSDLFALSEPEYRNLLAQWAVDLAANMPETSEDSSSQPRDDFGDLSAESDINQFSDLLDTNGMSGKQAGEANNLDQLKIPGPYGPPWPFVTEPVEFEIGSVKIRIEIEDENAKYPVGWGILEDANDQRAAQASVDTFCEWMGMDEDKINSLKEQLQQIGSIRSFKVNFQPISQKVPVTITAPSTRRRGVRRQQTAYKLTSVSPAEQVTKQTRDFCKLFHSYIIDTDMLAKPTILSETRKESALKYMGLWGSTQVNVNSAPRQVLEAAFTFGGDAEEIAAEIIKKRREKPFASIEEMKKELFRFSDTIEKSKVYITTTSNMFTIHITAVSGVAKASAVIVVFKEGGKIEQIAVSNG